MKKDENGYITVETLGCFLMFTLLIITILSIISIVTVQARVHYALTQTAETVSMYSYVLDLTGAASHIQNNSAKAGAVQGQVDEFKSNLNGLLNGIEKLDPDQIGSSGEALGNQIGNVAGSIEENPKDVLQKMMNYGVNKAGSAGFSLIVKPLFSRYLANGDLSGAQYLENYGVIDGLDGVEFYTSDTLDLGSMGANDSELLTANGDVKIVAQYDIQYGFRVLLNPGVEPKLHITQEVVTKAWLGGEGEGYQG